MNAFELVLNQIDAFIRKFYKNQMLKGLIIAFGVFIFTFLFVSVLEYFGRFNSFVRGILFFSFIGINLFLLVRYIFIPLSKMYSFGKRINRFQASQIIGKFFPEISDRLLNTLQLHDDLNGQEGNLELIRASVNQKSKSLSVFNFSQSIDFKQNKKYLYYTLPVLLIFLAVAYSAPDILKQGTERVVYYDKQFKEKAPFEFSFTSPRIEIEEGEDVLLDLDLLGSKIPDKVYLHSSLGKFLMNRQSKVKHSFFLQKVKSSVRFYFESNGFKSDFFDIVVIPKTAIGKFQASLVYPSYLGREKEIVKNAADLEVPEGTIIEWSVAVKNAEYVELNLDKQKKRFENDGFVFSSKLLNSNKLSVLLKNKNLNKIDSLSYTINVIKDAFPGVQVTEENDSISNAIKYFSGSINDDYGLTQLSFVYSIIGSNGKKRDFKIPVVKASGTEMPFTFAYDFRRENLQPKDKIEYYFVVQDNDGVNGSKLSRSQLFTYELPSLTELNEIRDEKQNQAKADMNNLLKRTTEFQKNIDRLKRDVLNSKSSDFNKMNQIQQLKEEQLQLQQELETLQDKMKESLDEKNMLSELDKELLEKQELLQKLLEELMDDELKDLLNQLEELMKNQKINQVPDKLEKLETKSEDMKKQLDRSLEMLKKMQVNEKLDDLQKELRELSEKQKELQKVTEKGSKSPESLQKEQEKINKEFEDLKKDLDEIKELNDALEKPMNLGDQEKEKNDITNDLQKAKESLDKNKQKKASESQGSGAEKMQKLADQLEKLQQESNKKQNEEDMESIRLLLESLMRLSFSQEDVMNRFAKIKDNGPYYKRLGRKQRSIVDDTKIVEDSLQALAKRNPKIASFIDQELNTINSNFKLGMEDIDEHRPRQLVPRLQFVMTSYNNLALLLNESLQQMQQQMQQQGSGSCDNPGGSGKKPKEGQGGDDMKETLKKQLEQMKKGMNPGGQKPGDKEGQGMLGLGNKEIAKMAAQQTAIRQKLEQMRNEMNKDGKGTGNKLNPLINQLEQQEKDLINKQFTPEMLNRQKDILTRLLESEKALMERGFDEKRESKSGKNLNYSNQKRLDEYNNQKLKQIELLKSVDPGYLKYYKDKANEYFNRF
jgi:hypothetical protein